MIKMIYTYDWYDECDAFDEYDVYDKWNIWGIWWMMHLMNMINMNLSHITSNLISIYIYIYSSHRFSIIISKTLRNYSYIIIIIANINM